MDNQTDPMAFYSFRDDYSDGAHPDIIQAITKLNTQIQIPYGEDEYTKDACTLIRKMMNIPDAAIHLVASGTLANIISIGSCLRPHEAIITASSGHIVGREAGAIEATGHKLIAVPPVKGKLTSESILQALQENSQFPHMAKPRMVYISNSTEVGTIYSKSELTVISELCQKRGLLLFLDGARLGVALASEFNDLTLEDIGRLTDIFWIGGTKLGLLLGEAIVITNPVLKEDFAYHIKQRGGLLAKGRILGVQFQALFSNNLFFNLALHANAMAKVLSGGIAKAGHQLVEDTVTNQIFVILPDEIIKKLQEAFMFYIWKKIDGGKSIVRLVTSWSTSTEQVEAFIQSL